MTQLHDESENMQFAWVPSGERRLAASIDMPTEGDTQFPVVIVMHGLTGNRLGRSYHLVEFGRRLAAHGIACVRFDQSGCGESTGRFVDMNIPPSPKMRPRFDDGWTSRSGPMHSASVTSASAWARCRPCRWMRNCRAGRWRCGRRCMTCRACSGTPRTGLRGILEGQGWVPYRGLAIGKSFVDHIGAVNTPEKLTANTSPMLVMHSKADDVVNFEEGQAYHTRCEALGRPCTFKTSSTANHDFSEYQDRQYLIKTNIDFFTRALDASQTNT